MVFPRAVPCPDYGPAFREYAYVTNGKSNTVSVIDLRTFALAKTITVGSEPTGIAANSKKNEIYVVNSGSSNVSVIDAETKTVAGDYRRARHALLHRRLRGRKARLRRQLRSATSGDRPGKALCGNVRVGSSPGLARVSPDGATVVVSNRADNTVSLIDAKSLRVRATLPVCQQPEDIAILPDSSKAFVACSGSSQVASILLKSGHAKDDRVLALLDVGHTPVSLALKPDGGELIVCNFDSDSISIIETGNDEVGSSLESANIPRAAWLRSTTPAFTSATSARTASRSTTSTWAAASHVNVGSHPDGLALTPDQNYCSWSTRIGRCDRDSETQATPNTRDVGIFPTDFDPGRHAAKCNRGESIHGKQAPEVTTLPQMT